MKHTKLQLLITLSAAVTASAFFAARGLPPSESLCDSASRGDVSCVRRTLGWGVAVNARGDRIASPLRYAAWNKRRDVVEFLIARGAEDRARRIEDARALVEERVAQANQWAARYVNGEMFVQSVSDERVVFFVPQGMPPSEKPPAGAIRRQWTDWEALTTERHYRYVIESLEPVDDEARRVRASLAIVGYDRVRRVTVREPVPAPPAGMELWRCSSPSRLFGIGAGWGRGWSSASGQWLSPQEPLGDKLSTLSDSALRRAIEAGGPSEERPIRKAVPAWALYDPEDKSWTFDAPQDHLELEWGPSLPQRDEPGVYSSDEF
ncbi:MAG: ankyrin repeat domain-containing protein [Planctomycetes bacterium]|nr:ankyrin repeat domain-containing protein [Planctomycetota bacterium]